MPMNIIFCILHAFFDFMLDRSLVSFELVPVLPISHQFVPRSTLAVGGRMSPTESQIASQYGAPLIPLKAVANILGRSPNSLRVLINQGRGDSALAAKLRDCRAQIG